MAELARAKPDGYTTMQEAGVKGYEITSWQAMFARTERRRRSS
ncbi:MAG: hypothetical protein ABWZ78_02935 [Burkholderiaceae bacterium]